MNKKSMISIMVALCLSSSPMWANAADEGSQNSSAQGTLTQLLLKAQGDNITADDKKEVEQQLALQDLIIKEADKLGLDNQSEVKSRIEMARRMVLVQAFWANYFQKNPVPEQDIKSAYEQLKKANGNTQYRISHIVVRAEDAAKKVMDKLKKDKGAFADVAQQMSEDKASSVQGGNLGWQWRTDINPKVFEKLESAKVGNVLEPVSFNSDVFVIVKLDDIRKQTFPAYDQVKSTVEAMIKQQIEQQKLQEMSKK